MMNSHDELAGLVLQSNAGLKTIQRVAMHFGIAWGLVQNEFLYKDTSQCNYFDKNLTLLGTSIDQNALRLS